MQKLLLLVLVFLGILSCSKDDTPKIEPTACFSFSKDTINFGEQISITDCSVNTSQINYFLDGKTITKDSLESISFENGARVSIKVTSESGETAGESRSFVVRPKSNSYYFPSLLPNSYGNRVLAFGENPILNRMYAFVFSSSEGEYYYLDISEDLEFTKTKLHNRSSDLGFDWALSNFDEDGTIYVDIPYVTAVSVERSRYEVNPTTGESWDPISLVNYDFDLSYLKYNDIMYSMGGNLDYDNRKYIPAINRNSKGVTVNLKEYDFGDRSGFIANMIPYNNGFLAYAISYDSNWGPDEYGSENTQVSLLELDAELNIQNTHELPEVSENYYSSVASFNAPFHMTRLPNNKILLYGLSSLRILNNDLSIFHSESLEGYSEQALLVQDEHFYLSYGTNMLAKYDFEGNVIASFEHGEDRILGIVPYKGNLLFMTTVRSNDDDFGRIFLGQVDTDLNLIHFED